MEGDAEGNKWSILINNNYRILLSTIHACGRICDDKEECKAIEWSPTQHTCTLIRIAKPDGPKYQDYIFCSKQGTNNFTKRAVLQNIVKITIVLYLRLILYTIAGSSCEDKHESCNGWASIGECTNNPAYMLNNCKKSCNQCGGNIISFNLNFNTLNLLKIYLSKLVIFIYV